MTAPRVASLLPAATEILCALGGEELLVARSHECDYPRSIERTPICTASRINSLCSSAEIEAQVKELQKSGSSLYTVDATLLRKQRPSLILTQGQCDVCAVSEADIKTVLTDWPGTPPQVLSLSPKHLTDLWEDMRRVGEAIGLPDQGRNLIKPLKIRVADIIVKTSGMTRRPRVACIEWIEPLMVAGNWVPELVQLAGGSSCLAKPGEHSDWIQWADLTKARPDIILMMPCGFDIPRIRREMTSLRERSEWRALNAVKNDRVYLLDGNQYFNRPGPRLVDSLEILCEILHPNLFEPKHKGRDWEPWNLD